MLSAPPGEEPKLSSVYTLLRRHKRGGLGTVWVVRDERAGREVALKKLRPDLQHDARSRELIRNEARLTAQLQHPNIVPVYDLGTDENGDFFYTMRLVHGRTLSEQIDTCTENRSSARLSPGSLRRLLDIFRGVCNAVAYAHSRGVVHLDLKPSNVLVGEFGEVILLDWGCAKHADRDLDPGAPAAEAAGKSLAITGTPAYMAPEQIQGLGDDICLATDIYQLGAMLYEILTAHPPHAGRSMTSVLRRIRGESVELDLADQARRANPAAPPALVAICGHALSADPEQRYRSVNELRRDIENWMADEPVSVYRDSAISGLMRWVRRHQKLATFACVTLFSLVLFNGQLLRLTVQERCNKLAHILAREMQVSVGAVDALDSLFETRDDVSRAEFGSFAGAYIDRHEQLAALEWIPVVSHAERAAYEAAVRASTWPSPEVARRFRFTERSARGRLVEASRRDRYFPVYYLEPYEENESAFGYDLGSSQARTETLRQADASGRVAISGPVELVQSRLGFLALSAVAHDPELTGSNDTRGYVLGVFRAEELVNCAWRDIDLDHFSIRVYDATDASKPRLVWSNAARGDPSRSAAVARPGLWGARRQITLWNRQWLVVVRPRLSFVLLYPFSSLTESSEPV